MLKKLGKKVIPVKRSTSNQLKSQFCCYRLYGTQSSLVENLASPAGLHSFLKQTSRVALKLYRSCPTLLLVHFRGFLYPNVVCSFAFSTFRPALPWILIFLSKSSSTTSLLLIKVMDLRNSTVKLLIISLQLIC